MTARCIPVALSLLLLSCAVERDPLKEMRILHELGRHAESIRPLRRIVDEDPANSEANLLLGRALLLGGDAGLAVWPLRRAAEAEAHAAEAGILLARAMLESRSAHAAVDAIERVLERDPDNVNALVLRMRGFLAVGRLDDGLADAERVLELDPDNLAVLVPRVTTLIALARIDEAETALSAAIERFEATHQPVPTGMDSRLCVARGLFAFEKGELEQADALYESCLAAFPDDPLVVVEAVSFNDRRGRQELATQLLVDANERSGDSFFRIQLARRMGLLGEREEEARLLRAEALERPSPQVWFALADLYVNRDEFGPALEAFERAIELDPEPSAMLRFAYADTLVQGGRLDEARKVADALGEPALRDLIHGRAHLSEGNPRAALAAFEAGIRLWPNNASGRFLSGKAAERIGDFDRAVSEYREALRANPGLTSAGLELALLQLAHGAVADALFALQRYVQARPNDPDVIVASIRAAHRAGRHGIAAEGLRRLAALPRHAVSAVVEEARLLGSDRGPALAVAAIEGAGLDLADAANLPALRALVGYLEQTGDGTRALALAEAALERNPGDPAVVTLAADVRLARGAPDARVLYERALGLAAQHGGALRGLAQIAAAAGDARAALDYYERALAADGADVEAALGAARIERELGRAAQAEARLRALLDQQPRAFRAARLLSEILRERGEADAARTFVAWADWLDPPSDPAPAAPVAEPNPGSIGDEGLHE